VGWQMLSGWTKMPAFGRYLQKLGFAQKAGGAAMPPEETDEAIIARVEAGLRYWAEHPESMKRVEIH